MSALQKSVLLMSGCLVLVFALSIGLSWWNYGSLDLPTVAIMTALLLPLIGAAAAVVLWSGRQVHEKPREVSRTAPRSLEAAGR